MPLHDNVKALRLARDLRQVDLADAVGLSKSAYSKFESGNRNLSVDELRAVAEAFGMPMDDVVDFDPDTPEGAPPPTPDAAHADDAERLRLIAELPPEDRETVYRVVDRMVAHHRFRTFFAQHAA